MRSKKVFFILPAVFFVLLVVALGCLNSKPNTLEFYLMDSGKKDVFEYLTQKFSAETKNRYKIEILTAADSRQYLRARIERKDIPDVIAMDGNSIYTELAEGGYLMNLEKEKFIKSINEHYINMLYQINGSKGREILGIPYAMNASGLMYNKAIFEKYGLTPPETWSELMDVCAVLKNAGIPAFAMSFGESWTALPVWNNLVPVLVPDSFIEQKNSGNTSFLQTHREVLEK
ncbi:MAG: ABC transporter substrate-binding protein, partial [Treponema porcinum]|nr:ABC transporter substrate-binding protein [Treponema porcinum]